MRLLYTSLPHHALARSRYIHNPTTSSRLLLSLYYYAALMHTINNIDAGKAQTKRAALRTLILSDVPVVMAHAKREAATIHALTLLGVVDPLGVLSQGSIIVKTTPARPAQINVRRAADVTGRIGALPTEPNRASTLLATTLLLQQQQQSHPATTTHLDLELNNLLLTVGDKITQPSPLDLSDLDLPSLIESAVPDTILQGQRREEELLRLGQIMLRYRLATHKVYIRAIQAFGSHVVSYASATDWPLRLKHDFDTTNNTIEDLQTACELHLSAAADMDEAQEMVKLCRMEQCNLRGCLSIYCVRAMFWPFVSSAPTDVSPFATSAMVAEQYNSSSEQQQQEASIGSGHDDSARAAANEHGRAQERIITHIFKISREQQTPDEMNPEVAQRIRGVMGPLLAIRMDSAESTLATFADGVQSNANFLRWTPHVLRCSLLVDAAKVLMEAQVITCAFVGKESTRSSAWSFLIRRAADALDGKVVASSSSTTTSPVTPTTSSNLRNGHVDKSSLLEMLPAVTGDIIRDMDAVASSARNAVRNERLNKSRSTSSASPGMGMTRGASVGSGQGSYAIHHHHQQQHLQPPSWQPATTAGFLSPAAAATAEFARAPGFTPTTSTSNGSTPHSTTTDPNNNNSAILDHLWADDPFFQLLSSWNHASVWNQEMS